MKKYLFASFICLFVCMGCSTFTPESTGELVGKSMYITYVKISNDKPDEFKAKVSDLWNEVDSIESTNDLKEVYLGLQSKFDVILEDSSLSDLDKKIILDLSNSILSKVNEVLENNFTQGDGLDFLIGVRNGIRSLTN